MSRLDETFKKWDRGEAVFDEIAEKLMEMSGGEKIGDILNEATICPVPNGSCTSFFNVELCGFGPKGNELREVRICPDGHKNIDECSLSK